MTKNRWTIVIASVVVVALAATTWAVLTSRNGQVAQNENRAKTEPTKDVGDHGGISADRVIGGSQHPAGKTTTAKIEKKDKSSTPEWLNYGALPPIKSDANPQVKAVAEALKQKNHPERVSVLIRPKAFDAKAYRADPAAYLNVVEPGRVFQTAQPGPGVPRLAPVSPRFQQIAQGESAVLRVHAPAGAPVSFTTFDCGQFENQLSAITVKANDEGIAEAKLTATTGTIADIHILAGSPMASSRVQFIVNVKWPQDTAAATPASSDDAS